MKTFLMIVFLNTMRVDAIPTENLNDCLERQGPYIEIVRELDLEVDVFCMEAPEESIVNGDFERALREFHNIIPPKDPDTRL